MICTAVSSYLKGGLEYTLLFDTFSSNFYQHHKFYNLLMPSPSKNDVTYKSIDQSSAQCALLSVKNLHGCSACRSRFGVWHLQTADRSLQSANVIRRSRFYDGPGESQSNIGFWQSSYGLTQSSYGFTQSSFSFYTVQFYFLHSPVLIFTQHSPVLFFLHSPVLIFTQSSFIFLHSPVLIFTQHSPVLFFYTVQL